jgi:hypothetical protein
LLVSGKTVSGKILSGKNYYFPVEIHSFRQKLLLSGTCRKLLVVSGIFQHSCSEKKKVRWLALNIKYIYIRT